MDIMKRITAAVLFFPALVGCSANNVVASDVHAAEDTLAAEVDSTCMSVCNWASQCATPTCNCVGDNCGCRKKVNAMTCSKECSQSMSRYQGHGEACANAGLGFLSCLSQASCSDLDQSDLCQPSESDRSTCGPANVSNTPPSTGPSAASAAGGAGSGPAGPPVVCQGSNSEGAAGAANAPATYVSCANGFDGCSDGHSYYSVCVVNDENGFACSCFRDKTLQGSFAPSVACPAVPEINARCGWQLAQP